MSRSTYVSSFHASKAKPWLLSRLYMNLKANADWMADLHAADAIIVATHSQGSVVSTHLLDQLIKDNHIVTARNVNTASMAGVGLGLSVGSGVEVSSPAVSEGGRRKIQRLCCLALCGIHLGPLRYLSSSTLVGPYIQVCHVFVTYSCHFFNRCLSAVLRVDGCS